MRAVLTEITDHGEFLELQAGWGRTIVCALARFGGRVRPVLRRVQHPADTRAVISRALDLLSQKPAELAPRNHGNPPV